MRNILVLTDFSAGAARVAVCAMAIATRLGADVLLVNVYSIRHYLPPGGFATLPVNAPGVERRESTTRLNREARRLEKSLRDRDLPGHRPVIRPIPLEGVLADRVSQLARRKKSVLVMIGVSGRSYDGFLFDGDIKAFLQQVSRPVLMIPSGWTGREVRHILFATDLAVADERAIGELVGLSARLKARVSLRHVSRPVLIPDFAELRNSAFIDRITSLYPGIGCHTVSAEKHTDVIALRYQKHPVWCRLFQEKPLKEAIEHGKTPLLIFPENPHNHD